MPYIIGTAGHIDHGKTSLIKALTGEDTDRLKEEKERGISIDLGFAQLDLGDGNLAGVVDVPGHERFIKNMLAGIGGIDAALLVIAADEGPMPQTIEHLAILDLLGVERGVIVLTKADAAETDWLDLVREEIRELVSTTALAGAPIVTVSALSGEGLPTLLQTLEAVLDSSPSTPGGGAPRLPVDRVFSVAGFGTVVTGTLSGGEISTGDELRLYPGERRARVRGLQSHQEKVSRALPGRRTAVNLSGITTEEVRRGNVLAPPGIMNPSQRLDVRLRLLPDAPVALKQNDEVDFFTGAAELPARITLLDRERLGPGESAWVQLRFREPIGIDAGKRFDEGRFSVVDVSGRADHEWTHRWHCCDPHVACSRSRHERESVISGANGIEFPSPECPRSSNSLNPSNSSRRASCIPKGHHLPAGRRVSTGPGGPRPSSHYRTERSGKRRFSHFI